MKGIPVRWIDDQFVREDPSHIPSFADWVNRFERGGVICIPGGQREKKASWQKTPFQWEKCRLCSTACAAANGRQRDKNNIWSLRLAAYTDRQWIVHA